VVVVYSPVSRYVRVKRQLSKYLEILDGQSRTVGSFGVDYFFSLASIGFVMTSLGLSSRTVHDYVARLYEHFRVRSRPKQLGTSLTVRSPRERYGPKIYMDKCI
jgi:hypothetical protein